MGVRPGLTMDCKDATEAIGALLDRTLTPGDQAALDDHMRTCASCRVLAADLRRMHESARSLPRVKPPETLWPRIASALDAEIRSSPRRWFGVSPWMLAAAATLLLAVGGTLLLLRPSTMFRPSRPAATATQTAGGGAAGAELAQSVESELREAEQHYERAIAGLEQIAKAEQGTLDPQVAATLQKNLAVIDQAIRESRAALQSQPASELAQESLFEALRRKVGLLQETIGLINEMRKGNQAGTARIIQNLNKS
jgi:anti-sigma factor RsiW